MVEEQAVQLVALAVLPALEGAGSAEAVAPVVSKAE